MSNNPEVNQAEKTLFLKIKHHPIIKLLILLTLFLVGLGLISAMLKPLTGFVFTAESMANNLGGVLLLVTALSWYFFVSRKLEKREIDELAFVRAPTELTTGILAAFIMVGTVIGIIALSGGYDVKGFQIPPTVWFTLCWLPTFAVLEELIFRGILFRFLEQNYGQIKAYIVSAVLFGLPHLFNDSATLISAFSATLGGLLMCMAYSLTKRLWLPIGFHIGWNFGQALMGSQVSGTDDFGQYIIAEFSGPDWLIGIDGIETSYVTLALLILVISIGYQKIRQQ